MDKSYCPADDLDEPYHRASDALRILIHNAMMDCIKQHGPDIPQGCVGIALMANLAEYLHLIETSGGTSFEESLAAVTDGIRTIRNAAVAAKISRGDPETLH